MAKGKKTGGRDIKPGEVRNPWGRPKVGESITECMKRYLEAEDPVEKRKRREILVENVYGKALANKDPAGIRLVWNYVDGMPKQNVDLTSGDKPINITLDL